MRSKFQTKQHIARPEYLAVKKVWGRDGFPTNWTCINYYPVMWALDYNRNWAQSPLLPWRSSWSVFQAASPTRGQLQQRFGGDDA